MVLKCTDVAQEDGTPSVLGSTSRNIYIPSDSQAAINPQWNWQNITGSNWYECQNTWELREMK